jgi:hypothetical protein
MPLDGNRFIHRLARRVIIEWVLSLVLCAGVLGGMVAKPWVTLAILLGVGVGLVVLLSRLELPKGSGLVRAGYWLFEPRPLASLHFLPPRELRERQRTMTSVKALTSLRGLLRDLDGFGVHFLYLETPITLAGRLGFKRFWPAAPLSTTCTVMQEMVAGMFRRRWPWIWVYMPDDH